MFFLNVIAPGFVMIPVLCSLLRYRYLGAVGKALLLYLAVSVLFNIIAAITGGSNNLPLLHLYTIIEFVVSINIFVQLFKRKKIRIFLYGLTVLYTCFAILYTVQTNTFFAYNDLQRFLSSLVLTLLAVVFILSKVTVSVKKQIEFIPFHFLAAFGLLLYFSCSSILFATSNYLLFNSNDITIDALLWTLHAIFMMMMYLTFAIAFLLIPKTK